MDSSQKTKTHTLSPALWREIPMAVALWTILAGVCVVLANAWAMGVL